MFLKKEQRYDKIITEINELIDQMINDIQRTIDSFDRNKFMQNCIDEYVAANNLVKNSSKYKKAINSINFAEFVFNKDKENQLNILNNVNLIINNFFNNIYKIEMKTVYLKDEINDMLIKPKLSQIFNKEIQKDYQNKIKNLNTSKIQFEHLSNLKNKIIEKTSVIKISRNSTNIISQLSDYKFNKEQYMQIHQQLKNFDVLKHLSNENDEWNKLFQLDLLNKFEDQSIHQLTQLIDDLKSLKNKNIINYDARLKILNQEQGLSLYSIKYLADLVVKTIKSPKTIFEKLKLSCSPKHVA